MSEKTLKCYIQGLKGSQNPTRFLGFFVEKDLGERMEVSKLEDSFSNPSQ